MDVVPVGGWLVVVVAPPVELVADSPSPPPPQLVTASVSNTAVERTKRTGRIIGAPFTG